LLCVGSEANNTYEDPRYVLRIDLGGNDTYLGATASAPFCPEAERPIALSVNVDVGGDDRYLHTGKGAGLHGGTFCYDSVLRWIVAQGYGAGGTGILVDASGNDEYALSAGPFDPDVPRETTEIGGQGASVTGFGGLFDLGGRDSYRIETEVELPGLRVITGQGSGRGGVGILIDKELASDSYLVQDRKAKTSSMMTHFYAQGMGTLGVGILSDGGGEDTFTAEGSGAIAMVQGAREHSFGEGWLLTGDGDTRYEARFEGFAWLHAQGVSRSGLDTSVDRVSALSGGAVLEDLSGDDSYIAVADYHPEPWVVRIDDDWCASNGDGVCSDLTATIVESEMLIAQGASLGWTQSGMGLLADHAGNDTYLATNTMTREVAIDDRLNASGESASFQVVNGSMAPALAVQGAASAGGDGVLVDAGGTDQYRARFEKNLVARGSVPGALRTRQVRAYNLLRVGVAAQGGGWEENATGALFDLGGTGDTFVAEATMPIQTHPAGSEVTGGFPLPHFHGSGYVPYGAGDFSRGILVARGTDPTIVSIPAQRTCPDGQPRGGSSWTECALLAQGEPAKLGVDSYGLGFGLAPQSTASPSNLQVEVHEDASAIATTAVVTGATGAPVAGVPVRIAVEMLAPPTSLAPGDPLDERWTTLWEQVGVTGMDGRADLSFVRDLVSRQLLQGFMEFESVPGWRVSATFGGAEGLLPSHATVSLQQPPA
jgi:hypothetical protein